MQVLLLMMSQISVEANLERNERSSISSLETVRTVWTLVYVMARVPKLHDFKCTMPDTRIAEQEALSCLLAT